LDSLSGLFAAGLAPTAAKDPFGQRRTALGLVAALSAWDLDFDLRSGLGLAAALQPLSSTPEVEQAILEFIAGRLRGVLLEEGFRYDVVEAVLAAQQHNPAGARRAARALTARVEDPAWAEIQPAHARCVRILRTAPGEYACDPARLVEESEKALYADLLKAEQKVRKPGSVDDFFAAFTPLVPAINHFFDTVLVMTEDPSLRDNRLGLLQRITALDHGVADLSLLEGF
jgi:glycyl-tRNA synthetase